MSRIYRRDRIAVGDLAMWWDSTKWIQVIVTSEHLVDVEGARIRHCTLEELAALGLARIPDNIKASRDDVLEALISEPIHDQSIIQKYLDTYPMYAHDINNLIIEVIGDVLRSTTTKEYTVGIDAAGGIKADGEALEQAWSEHSVTQNKTTKTGHMGSNIQGAL